MTSVSYARSLSCFSKGLPSSIWNEQRLHVSSSLLRERSETSSSFLGSTDNVLNIFSQHQNTDNGGNHFQPEADAGLRIQSTPWSGSAFPNTAATQVHTCQIQRQQQHIKEIIRALPSTSLRSTDQAASLIYHLHPHTPAIHFTPAQPLTFAHSALSTVARSSRNPLTIASSPSSIHPSRTPDSGYNTTSHLLSAISHAIPLPCQESGGNSSEEFIRRNGIFAIGIKTWRRMKMKKHKISKRRKENRHKTNK